MEGIQPTMPIGGDGFGTGSGIWLFAILALFLFGGGRGFGMDGSRAATVEDLNNSANFTRLESQVAANNGLVERKTDALANGICDLGYKLATDMAATNQLIVAESQKTRDLIQQNKIEAMQARISQLELQQAMSGVVRYPNGLTYNAGTSPFCGCGCSGTSTL